jgi:hypothetical protein
MACHVENSTKFKTASIRGVFLLGLVLASTSLVTAQSAPYNTGPNFWTPPGSPVNMASPPPTSFPGLTIVSKP